MGFDEFLDQHMSMKESDFNQLSPEAQNAIYTSYYLSMENVRRAQAAARQLAEEEEREAMRAARAEKRQRQQAWYDKWNQHFLDYARKPVSPAYIATRKLFMDQQTELAAQRKAEALEVARYRTRNHPEQLLFAEADALAASTKMESWGRCIPVGRDFAEQFDYAREMQKPGETFSEAMRNLDPMSVEFNMYSKLVERFDKDPNLADMGPEDAISRIYENDPDARKFYDEHRLDDEKFANPENLDFAMNEVFRLGERMSRNSRMSGPMKELCTKINSLKKDYAQNKDDYKKMPLGRIQNLMQSIMFSADAYVADKKNLKSFSSTQLERLKCINQLKFIQESLAPNVKEKADAYSMAGNHRDCKYSYVVNALAEKMTLATYVKSKDSSVLCDHQLLNDKVVELMEAPNFKNFVKDAVDKTRQAKGQDYPISKVYDHLLKTNGQKLIAGYEKYCKQEFKKDYDTIVKGKNKAAAPEKANENSSKKQEGPNIN